MKALLSEKILTEDQRLLGLRRSVKGNASNVLRRFGIGLGIEEVMAKLQSTFNSIESEEILLRKLTMLNTCHTVTLNH